MNPDLKKLIRLQQVDLSIQELRDRLAGLPALSRSLDDKLTLTRTNLERAKSGLEANQAQRRNLEGEVAVVRTKTERYRDQLMSVKTNDEYRALLKEIEFHQGAVQKTEDEILDLMEEAEGLERGVRAAEDRLKEEQRRVKLERLQLEEASRRDAGTLDSYAKERKEFEVSITSEILLQYERIRKARGGVAVADARDEACAVCNVRLRPQCFQEIRSNERIIVCESCNRILYDPDNLDHPFERP